mmetsp:Transcript_108215/g.304936  ORF Transcript_108215/g.304936 Transcript_108215/m.304936 type:complete len:227 (-) Transcript_108215:1324-2004(-)
MTVWLRTTVQSSRPDSAAPSRQGGKLAHCQSFSRGVLRVPPGASRRKRSAYWPVLARCATAACAATPLVFERDVRGGLRSSARANSLWRSPLSVGARRSGSSTSSSTAATGPSRSKRSTALAQVPVATTRGPASPTPMAQTLGRVRVAPSSCWTPIGESRSLQRHGGRCNGARATPGRATTAPWQRFWRPRLPRPARRRRPPKAKVVARWLRPVPAAVKIASTRSR